MIIEERHFDADETQLDIRMWLEYIDAQIGEEHKIQDFLKWINSMNRMFLAAIGEKTLGGIENRHERQEAFLREQIASKKTNGQMTIFDILGG